MPEYSFVCEQCDKTFEVKCSISEYDNGNFKCAHCGSKKIYRNLMSDISNGYFAIRKHDSELKTIGDLANRNSDRFSEDKKNHLFHKHNDYRKDNEGKLPDGMTRIKKTKKVKWRKDG
jgi:putative FmdB family regulatory protein